MTRNLTTRPPPGQARDCRPLPAPRQQHPDVGAQVPRAAEVVAEHRVDDEAGALEARRHLRHGQRAESELEAVLAPLPPAPRGVALIEDRQPPDAILANGLDQLDARVAPPHPAQRLPVAILVTLGPLT